MYETLSEHHYVVQKQFNQLTLMVLTHVNKLFRNYNKWTNTICVFQLVFKISNNKTYFEMKNNVADELITQPQRESGCFVPGSIYL